MAFSNATGYIKLYESRMIIGFSWEVVDDVGSREPSTLPYSTFIFSRSSTFADVIASEAYDEIGVLVYQTICNDQVHQKYCDADV
ncbi:hypothetical protein CEXT_521521 [Caerostris extrusa]|uniref:Uncharacterized protein n=1 Tax=Caerostris extrusa TaxID=172846 RepID=A0AAV4SMV8_CAEEX|nr:hypothetical protein CEXT_521521 [Caerostris extrusa]